MVTRLELARERLASGDTKRALAELWHAEAEHRTDAAGLQEALSLAEATVERTEGRRRKEASLLLTVLTSDLTRAPAGPPKLPTVQDPVLTERANRNARRSLVWGLVAIPSVILFGLGGVFGIVGLVYGVRAFQGDTDRVNSAFLGLLCGAIALLAAAWVLYELATFDLGPGY